MEIQFAIFILSVCCGSLAIPTNYNCGDCDAERCVEEEMECCSACSAKIRCTPTQMIVAIPRSSTRIPLKELSFAHASCGGTQNDTHFILKTSYGECGTIMVPIRNSHYVYKNEIRRRDGQPLYSLTCLFDRTLKPSRRHLRVKTGENKQSKLYHTSMEGRRLKEKKVYLEDDDYLFFEVKGPSTLRARNLIMGVKKCQLEITEDSDEPGINPRIDVLIKDGCPVKKEVRFVQQSGHNLWFSYHIQDVKQDRNDTAVLNCSVQYCMPDNVDSCKFQCA